MSMNDPQPAETLVPKLVRRFAGLVAAMALFVLLFTAGGFAARLSWRLELLCHFRVQYFWLLLLAGALLLAARHWRRAAAAALGAAVNLAAIAPIYWPATQPPTTSDPLHVVSFNVLSSNTRYDDVLAYLRREQADIVLLLEVSPAWAEQLAALHDLYPHQHLVPRSDNFGLALLSQRPWADAQAVLLGGAEVPSIVAEFARGGNTLTFVGAHPVPPGSADNARLRNEQLAAIAALARERAGPVIVAGDLNITDFSPYFGDLLAGGNLRDSRQGWGVQASWFPRLPGMGIAIDHCLISPDLEVQSRRIGPFLGSDHRPVSTRLR